MSTRAHDPLHEYAAIPLFAEFSRAQLSAVERAVTRLELEAGSVLVRQGQRERQFVVVLQGVAEVWRDGQPVDQVCTGSCFGEISLIRRIPEPATLVARTGLTVAVIARQDFATIYAGVEELRRRLDESVDRRMARWLRASDAPVSDATPARPHRWVWRCRARTRHVLH
jgi:CRP-like cAMP-binding protein